jgi:hypothetical protein
MDMIRNVILFIFYSWILTVHLLKLHLNPTAAYRRKAHGRMLKLPYIGLEEITKDKVLISKQLLAEFMGTLILVSKNSPQKAQYN